jgi:CHASE2 domain-containing sensor protein
MSKLVVLKFTDGSFEVGFAVTLQIGEEGSSPSTEIPGRLPPLPEMPLYYSHWQSSYRRLSNRYRLSADQVQVTNVSIAQECDNTAQILRARFNTWLRSEEFRPLREKWLERLLPTDEIRVILQTENHQLQRLPWHLWDLLERYPQAEIALSSPIYDRVQQPPIPNPQINILAILGNSQGIDTQADEVLLQQLPDADVSFVVEPQRQELTDSLWGKNWDILFFAGHSCTQDNHASGRIYINKTDSLTISELKYALRKAAERGLQLAIFNSCDGLGLARELADLQIPQIIVMREPVPDQVAQAFLKYFLEGFASGEPLYLAVRQARERLQGLEDKFPCATWLPMICQNLAHIPPTWEKLKTGVESKPQVIPIPSQNPAQVSPVTKPRFGVVLLSSLVITAVVGGMRFLGMLQTPELQAFDFMMRSRPVVVDEKPDPRLLVVKIEDKDLATQRRSGESLKGTSLSDKSLNLLLEKLEKYQPRAIGLDIYRDFKAESPDLIARLQQTENLIGVCKGSDTTANTNGIAPPPEIPKERQGFSDFIHDADGVVRRHLMFMHQEAVSLCPATYAFSLQLALRYLAADGILPNFTPEANLQIGDTVVKNISPRTGGYQGIDANSGQILLNWRSSKKIAEQVTLTEVLSGQINPNAVKDKIVLIGVAVKADFPDYWATPYGAKLDEQMPGVLVQAHMVSQIISAIKDKRPLLWVWSPWVELIWICSWSVVGGILAWRWRSFSSLALAVGITSGMIYCLCFAILIRGGWVPFVPSVLVLVATSSGVALYLNSSEGRSQKAIRWGSTDLIQDRQ